MKFNKHHSYRNVKRRCPICGSEKTSDYKGFTCRNCGYTNKEVQKKL